MLDVMLSIAANCVQAFCRHRKRMAFHVGCKSFVFAPRSIYLVYVATFSPMSMKNEPTSNITNDQIIVTVHTPMQYLCKQDLFVVLPSIMFSFGQF